MSHTSPIHTTPAPDHIRLALHRGLAYLRRTQRPSGEFTTYASRRLDMAGAQPYPKIVYFTTFVMHALTTLPGDEQIEAMLDRAAAFIAAEQDDNGAWNYEGRGGLRVPPDLDDTACAVAALLQRGQRPDVSFFAALWQNETAPGGPYYTWMGVNQDDSFDISRQVDALVNANILFCCALLGINLPGTLAYLRQVIAAGVRTMQGIYWIAPQYTAYAITRAYLAGAADLAPDLPLLREELLTDMPGPAADPSAFNLACAAAALLNLGAEPAVVAPYVAALLERQSARGGWPNCPIYDSFDKHYDGCPALTTALALEALNGYLRRCD